MIVVDASVATKWFIYEAGRQEAIALRVSNPQIIAPEFIIAEVLNAAWRNARIGKIRPEEMKAIAAAPLSRYFAKLVPLAPLATSACDIALALDHPIYDCLYLALASAEKCDLVTSDDRLYRKTRRTRFAKLVRKLA